MTTQLKAFFGRDYFSNIAPAFLVFAFLFVSSCGFHLKGSGLSQLESAVKLNPQAKTKLPVSLYEQLRRILNSNLAKPDSAELLIHNYIDETRRLSQADRSVSDELIFIYRIEYSIAVGDQLIGPLQMQTQRVFQSDTRQALANNSEYALLQSELLNDLGNRLAQQVNILLKNQASPNATAKP